MAKVRFFCDSGANIKSENKSELLDTVEDLGYAEGEWENLPDAEKYKAAEEWAWENGLMIAYNEEI